MGFDRWWRRVSRNIFPTAGGRPPKVRRPMKLPISLLVALTLLAIIVVSLAVVDGRLRPIVTTLARVEVENRFVNVLDQAILSDLTSRGTGYDDFVTIERDSDGAIRALTTNMASMNLLRAEIECNVTNILGEMDASTIAIPLGSLFPSDLLWGRGPDITARSITVGVLHSEFVSEFTEAGINQTSHRIYLDIRVPLTILIAGGTIETEISTYLCVAETIIVGSVPNSYLQLQ